jgi:ribosomal protein L28
MASSWFAASQLECVRQFRQVVQGQAKRGLFARRHITFGNQISFSGKKHRRSWKPNVQHKRYWSETLQETLRIKVTRSYSRIVHLLADCCIRVRFAFRDCAR